MRVRFGSHTMRPPPPCDRESEYDERRSQKQADEEQHIQHRCNEDRKHGGTSLPGTWRVGRIGAKGPPFSPVKLNIGTAARYSRASRVLPASTTCGERTNATHSDSVV